MLEGLDKGYMFLASYSHQSDSSSKKWIILGFSTLAMETIDPETALTSNIYSRVNYQGTTTWEHRFR